MAKEGAFEIDSFEKALRFIEAMRWPRAEDRLSAIFEYYPELWDETHESLAGLIGLARETVTRTLKGMRSLKNERDFS